MVPPLPFQGQTVLVTGGCGDLGGEMAAQFGARGARVVVWDVQDEADARVRLDAIASRLDGGKLHYQRVDVRDRAAVDAALDAFHAEVGLPDVICANAGIVESAPFLELTVENWQRHLDINLTGAFHTAQAAARRMVAANQSGRIIFTTSWVGEIPWPEITAYTVSKAGLNMLMKQMARELAVYGIRVNAVAPGIVRAGMAGRQLREEPQYAARVAKVIPLGEPGAPVEVAQAVVYLASPETAYMTGSILLIDGGCSLFQFDS